MMSMVTAANPTGLQKQPTTSNPILNPSLTSSSLAGETEFFMALKRSISDGIRDAMGPQILAMLQDRGMLDNPAEASKLHKQLSVLFGNGTSVLEKIIIKELYRKLNISYDTSAQFDYETALLRAKRVYATEAHIQ
jgi:hypothetical protein